MKNRKRNAKGSQLAEFGPVLIVFFLLFLFPLLNLIAFATGSATVWMLSRQCASRASNSPDFTTALNAAQQEAKSITASGFGKFAHLTPVGGAGGSGINLIVNSVPVSGGSATTYAANTKLSPPIDTTANIYEYVAEAHFMVGPFLNMGGVPFVGSVPAVGKPAEVDYMSVQSAEYPDGVTQ